MSKPLVVTIPHQLGAAEARRRIETGLADVQRQLPAGMAQMRQAWTGDRLSFSAEVMGQGASGWLEVGEREVRLEVLLPGVLGLLAGKIRGKVERQGAVLLEDKRR